MSNIDNIKFLFVWLIFFSVTNNAASQKIAGFVKDTSGKAISWVSVSILNHNKTTLTDSNGYFEFRSIYAGHYLLSFAAFGYATELKKVEVNSQDLLISVSMIESVINIDEIVVTANKNEENIMDVPLSMTSLSASKIQDTRTWELENMVGLVPNFQYADVGVGYQQQMALRGVSVFSENPTIATYVDGVNSLDISSNGFQLTDIDRIEILRGPQGTLYGRNAMAGVINIITKKPTSKPTSFVELSTGSQGLQRYTASFKTPMVNDKLFAGLTIQFQRMHGYLTSDTSEPFTYFSKTFYGPGPVGVRMGDENSYYGNLSIRWYPHTNSELIINSKSQYDYSTSPSTYYQAAVNDSIALSDPYKITVNRFGSNKRFVCNNSLSYKHHFKNFTLTSISAYQYVLQAYNNVDFDYWSFDVAYASSFYKKIGDAYPQKVFSQEIRINSLALSKSLKWTVGTYFFNQVYNMRTATTYVPPLGLLFGYTGTDVSQSDRNNTGMAAFGQASYRITNQLELTFGLRYDYEVKKALVALFNIDSLGNRTYKRPEAIKIKSFSAFSPKAILQYSVEENQQLYTSYAKGYRAGGINMFTNVEGYETFQPEYSDNYELGYKVFAKDRKFLMTMCVYFMEWKNLQLDYRPSNSNSWVTDNLGGVKSRGAEVEVTTTPIRNLQMDASIGINDAVYKDFQYIGIQIGGNRTILAPNITSILAPQYTIPLCRKRKSVIVLRTEWRHIGDQYFDLANKIEQPAYNIINARAGIRFLMLECFLWAQNIGNVKFISYAPPAYFRYTLLARPGSYGITLNAKF